MLTQKLALLAVSVSSVFAASLVGLTPRACSGRECLEKYEDADAMELIISAYHGDEAAVPESLKKSIGSCKFAVKSY